MIEMRGHDALWMCVGYLVLHSPLTPLGLVERLAVYFLRERAGGVGGLLILAAPFAGDSLPLVSSAPLGLAVPSECTGGYVF